MKAFVTGSTGLLGSNLVRLLAQEGCEVKGLARSASKAKMQLGDTDAQIITGDINDPDTFVSDLSGCDVLFHTAAYFRESFQSTKDHWPMLEETNINNTLNLFEMAVEKGVS
ncbi:NAD-dependent epimerase/dehydratase family protein [Paenibacillus sp. GD4]|uniref:NAD-dependent epimerase/dehydratase family protein n=1 Tax=Paenibacillus sp. GD4 TaxID=3068890 RepID=UPI0027966682|nr:NAD-dependent epimerase/dehydratase family protein [Paenibacillus sp. GD4]MDQ1913728.1 NAD-dependent epimerase/dehydratase family protein [Paenibacillus sp. GD4]